VKAFILDASLAIAWFFPSTPRETNALEKRVLFDDRVALVPTIWRAEIVNFISRLQVLGTISQAEAAEVLHQLVLLPVGVIDDPPPGELLSLSAQFRLTSYDALYLHAAMSSGEPLATLDSGLIRAAGAAGVQLA